MELYGIEEEHVSDSEYTGNLLVDAFMIGFGLFMGFENNQTSPLKSNTTCCHHGCLCELTLLPVLPVDADT